MKRLYLYTLLIFIFISCSNKEEFQNIKYDIEKLKLKVDQNDNQFNKQNKTNELLESEIDLLKKNFKDSEKNAVTLQAKIKNLELSIAENIQTLNLSYETQKNIINNLTSQINEIKRDFSNNSNNLTPTSLTNTNTTNITKNVEDLYKNSTLKITQGNIYFWGESNVFSQTSSIPKLLNSYDWIDVKLCGDMVIGLSPDSLLYILNYEQEFDSLYVNLNENEFDFFKYFKNQNYQIENNKILGEIKPVLISKTKFTKFFSNKESGLQSFSYINHKVLYCFDSNNFMWVYGSNSGGVLGIGSNISRITKLTKTNHKFEKIYNKDYHIIGLKQDNTLWEWGQSKNYPQKINDEKWLYIEMDGHILGIKEDSTLWDISNTFINKLNNKVNHLNINSQSTIIDNKKWKKISILEHQLILLLSNEYELFILGFSDDHFFGPGASFIFRDNLYQNLNLSKHLKSRKGEGEQDTLKFIEIYRPLKISNLKFQDIKNLTGTFNGYLSGISVIMLSEDNYLYGFGSTNCSNFGNGSVSTYSSWNGRFNSIFLNKITKLNDLQWESITDYNNCLIFGKIKQ